MRIFQFIAVLISMMIASSSNAQGLSLGDETLPINVRQEKALVLLRSWGFEAQDAPFLFTLNDEDRLRRVELAIKHLELRAAKTTSDCDMSSVTERYLTWVAYRWHAIDKLDFSDAKLSHFFHINRSKYSCEQRATVAELLVPHEYVQALEDGGGFLTGLEKRLSSEQFAQVSYDVTSKFSAPSSGFKGELRRSQVEEKVWESYVNAWNNRQGGLGGPYQLEGGYLFVKVFKLLESEDDCFAFSKDRVAQDYAREWLKKIYTDTLTTVTNELQPDIEKITTVPLTTDVAFTIGNRQTSFGEAKQMLPFLSGDEKSIKYWESICNQALEIEMLYQSGLGREVLDSEQYGNMKRLVCMLTDGQQALDEILTKPVDDDKLREWFDANKYRYSQPDRVSYKLVQCSETTNSALCAAFLEKISEREPGRSDGDGAAFDTETTSVANVQWDQQPLPVQVAIERGQPGEWSEVFSLDDRPTVLYLQMKILSEKRFDSYRDHARVDYKIELRERYWKEFLGLD